MLVFLAWSSNWPPDTLTMSFSLMKLVQTTQRKKTNRSLMFACAGNWSEPHWNVSFPSATLGKIPQVYTWTKRKHDSSTNIVCKVCDRFWGLNSLCQLQSTGFLLHSSGMRGHSVLVTITFCTFLACKAEAWKYNFVISLALDVLGKASLTAIEYWRWKHSCCCALHAGKAPVMSESRGRIIPTKWHILVCLSELWLGTKWGAVHNEDIISDRQLQSHMESWRKEPVSGSHNSSMSGQVLLRPVWKYLVCPCLLLEPSHLLWGTPSEQVLNSSMCRDCKYDRSFCRPYDGRESMCTPSSYPSTYAAVTILFLENIQKVE